MATKVTKKKEVLEEVEAKTEEKETAKAKPKKASIKKKTTAKKTVKKAAPKKKAVKAVANKEDSVKADKKENLNSNSYLIIDFPVEAEKVYSRHYAIRIGASVEGYVELAFNEGEWIPCRFDDGYWWFDWVYFTPGKYTIAARMIDPEGKIVIQTPPRKCTVC